MMKTKTRIIIVAQVIACCLFMTAWHAFAPGPEVEPNVILRSLLVFGVILSALATLFTALQHALWQNVAVFISMWVVGSYLAIQRTYLGYAYEGDPGVFSLTVPLLPVAPMILYIVFVTWISERIGKRLTNKSSVR
jgi:hypothetical protein